MAAGLGTRMRSATPKHLHPLLGRRVIDWVLDAARALEPQQLVVVTSPDGRDGLEGVELAVQEQPLGTGDAVAAARPALADFDGDVLVLDGAAPLLTPKVLHGLVEEHRRSRAAVTLLTFSPETPFPYGRILRDDRGAVVGIVEDGDATAEQREIRELNSSIYVFASADLWPALERLEPANAQGELYLTDTVRELVQNGRGAAAFHSPDPVAPIGVNTRAELAAAAAVLRDRVNERHMLAGVTIVDPASTWIDADVHLEAEAIIHPFTVLRGRTSVAAGAEIGPHVVAVDTAIGVNAVVGPFCYLRPGTVLEERAKAGTFVEIKNSRIGRGAKVPHSSYVGDAEVGEGTNIAAGNITANYPHEPGRPKEKTVFGRNVRTGVDNSFRAPVTIGDDAWIAAGSVITEDVPPGALAGFPPRQAVKEDYVYKKGDERRDDD
jgi:bifunctional UDP-N-acetylglucosamine pyrophosphorylase/glucosamine-1-phosphate N-acetyltransferase